MISFTKGMDAKVLFPEVFARKAANSSQKRTPNGPAASSSEPPSQLGMEEWPESRP